MRLPIIISSGHGKHVPGARCIIDEVTEARHVAERISQEIRRLGGMSGVFHEDRQTNARDNVNEIIRVHNSFLRLLDVSVHFNAVNGGRRIAGIGTETLYREGNTEMRRLASDVSKAITGASGLILRRGDGTWGRTNLGFLNRTDLGKAILLEVCFVNSETDVALYKRHFSAICAAIAATLTVWANGR